MTHNKFWFANCIVCIDDFYSNVLLFIAPEITRSRLTTFMTSIAIFKLTHTHSHKTHTWRYIHIHCTSRFNGFLNEPKWRTVWNVSRMLYAKLWPRHDWVNSLRSWNRSMSFHLFLPAIQKKYIRSISTGTKILVWNLVDFYSIVLSIFIELHVYLQLSTELLISILHFILACNLNN